MVRAENYGMKLAGNEGVFLCGEFRAGNEGGEFQRSTLVRSSGRGRGISQEGRRLMGEVKG